MELRARTTGPDTCAQRVRFMMILLGLCVSDWRGTGALTFGVYETALRVLEV